MEAPIAGKRLSSFSETTSAASKQIAGIQMPAITTPVSGSTVKAFPNPFSHKTVVEIASRESGRAIVDVVDAAGRSVYPLFNGEMIKGLTYKFTLDATRIASGIYAVRFSVNNNVTSYKIIKYSF